MTSKEIEKFIKKNIIDCIGVDLIQKGTYILINPFDDIIGGFCFERSGIDKSSIYIWWFVQPLFIPDQIIHLTFGDRLENIDRDQLWHNLDSIETIETIKAIIKSKLSLVKSLMEPNLFYEYFNKKNKENLRIHEALIYISIWIESDNWRQDIQNFINDIDVKFDTSIPWIKKIKDDMIDISLSNNPKKILEDNRRHLIECLNV